MNANPKISVIVPVYNTEKYLKRCIDSILEQSYSDFELLLIDDGSKDGSGAICNEYAAKDSRVHVFHKPNGGASSARNVGLDNAKGEWIAFADADDILSPRWLQAFEDGLRMDNPDIVIAGFGMIRVNGHRQNIGISCKGDVRQCFPQVWSLEMKGSLCNKLFKLSIIDKYCLRLDTNLSYREDEEFTIKYLSYCSELVCIDEPTYRYFEPDWSKYNSSEHSVSGQRLESSVYESMKRLGAKTFLRKQRVSVTNRCLYNIKSDKRNAFRYAVDYLRTLGVVDAGCMILRIILFKFRIIKEL